MSAEEFVECHFTVIIPSMKSHSGFHYIFPLFLPGESHGRRSLVGYNPQGRRESDTTERLHFHFFFLFPLKLASIFVQPHATEKTLLESFGHKMTKLNKSVQHEDFNSIWPDSMTSFSLEFLASDNSLFSHLGLSFSSFQSTLEVHSYLGSYKYPAEG